MKRPERIPEDVWERLTVREACVHGLLTVGPRWMQTDQRLMSEQKADTFIAGSLRDKVAQTNQSSLNQRFRAIRAERAQNARYAACPKHEAWNSRNACMHCGMAMAPERTPRGEFSFDAYVWNGVPDDRIRGAKAEQVIVDEPLDIAPSEFDPRNELVNAAKREINIALQMGHSPLELQQALERVLGSKTDEITHSLTRVFYCSKNRDNIRPNTSAPALPPKFREDICQNDGPLLPPFEAGEPTDRVTVMMLYPYVSQLGERLPIVRCSLNPHSFRAHHIECRRRLGGPPSGFQWISHSRELDDARTRIADEVLSFDLAVRTGESLAVSAYGLILFALAVGAERERERARTAMSEADEAMDAVFRAARDVSEGE